MGRFGNVMLTGGETEPTNSALESAEVVRFWLTNTANTRLFNVALPGARMKLVGGDSGRYEHESSSTRSCSRRRSARSWTCSSIAPGSVPLEHRTPSHTYSSAW